MSPVLSCQHRVLKTVLAGGLGAGLLVLYIVPPSSLPLTDCLFHDVTGHSCLTCGMTRSLHAFSHGRFASSIQFHLFGPVVWLGLFMGFVGFLTEAIRGRKITLPVGKKVRYQTAVLFVLVWFVYWGARIIGE